MTSLTTSCVILFSCSVLIGICRAGLSTNMYNFMEVFNGNYDNLHQYYGDKMLHDYTQLRSVPVTTPALPGQPVIFIEYAVNGGVFNRYLCDLTEDINGTIHLAIYNITDTRKYKPGEYKVENLSKLTPEDIHRPSNCSAVFLPNAPGTFLGTWEACRHYVKGKHPLYSVFITCNNLEEVTPRSATETSSSLPYNLVRKGDRSQVPDVPVGYVSPCL